MKMKQLFCKHLYKENLNEKVVLESSTIIETTNGYKPMYKKLKLAIPQKCIKCGKERIKVEDSIEALKKKLDK